MNIKDDFILSKINKGYLVGGSVRDFLMGKAFVDRDIAIKNAKNFAQDLAQELDATFIELRCDVDKITKVTLNGVQVPYSKTANNRIKVKLQNQGYAVCDLRVFY